MAEGGFQHPGRDVQLGGTDEKCREDGRDGMLSLSGSGHPIGGGVRAEDDRYDTIVTGEGKFRV